MSGTKQTPQDPTTRQAQRHSKHRAKHRRLQQSSERHNLKPRALLLTIVMFIICTFIGYGITTPIFSFTGSPPELIAHALSSLVGLLLVFFTARIIAGIYWKKVFKHSEKMNSLRKPLDDTIDAVNRIAQGDFSVLLPVYKHDPFSILAESVNKMAHELGSMENLRQDFISNVSHEIQSPLTSINGFASLLRSETLTPEQRSHYLDIIETEAKRMSRLSDNLLKLSSLESQPLSIGSFSLTKQLENAVLMLEPQWSERQQNLELSLEKLSIQGDEALLSQVWINLLSNAIKFTPEGGDISISLELNDGKALCRVADTGCGITPEDQIHIFERFYKADKSRDRVVGGNGLGLSLVKKIVELHGGAVAVQSEPGAGTAFTVTLPLS